MNEHQLTAEAKRRNISVAELKTLLGSGSAFKAALTLKDRKKQLDEQMGAAGG